MSNLPRYDIRIGETKRSYEFTSIGIKGKIDKMVSFQETNIENLYNLGFGDKDPITGEIDDTIVTNNRKSFINNSRYCFCFYAKISKCLGLC